MANSVDNERLKRLVEKSIVKVFKDALSFIEMSVTDKSQYKSIRKMILRSGNDEIRKIKEELDKFEVKYNPRYDEIIDFEDKPNS